METNVQMLKRLDYVKTRKIEMSDRREWFEDAMRDIHANRHKASDVPEATF